HQGGGQQVHQQQTRLYPRARLTFHRRLIQCVHPFPGCRYHRSKSTAGASARFVPEGCTMNSEFPTIADCVGNTPLVRLQRMTGNTSNTILLKLEGNNPAGSVKDRPALSMIRLAEQRGDIHPGDTLIEATSGNTGIALAM